MKLSPRRKRRPVIAILTVSGGNRPFGGNPCNFIDLIQKGQEMGALVYVTTVEQLDLSRKRIAGHGYNARQKTWEKRTFPFPQVIYNRIPYRKAERTPEIQKLIEACLKDSRVALFNPFFFNKWTLFEWLSRASSTRPFIPRTEKLVSYRNLESLFERYPTLYLKPVRGKAGKGIMRAERREREDSIEYVLIHPARNKRRIDRFPSIYDLWIALKKAIGNKEYIVQQGIVLTQYRKRPYDLRVLVQKDEKGAWSLTGIGARVAGKRSITTHVPRGGSIGDPGKLLRFRFGPRKAAWIIQRTGSTALMIARQIEKAAGQTLGEMSMDLGVDRDGALWFFEANSKPMKFDEPHIRKKSLEQIIHYCMYLSKKRKQKKHSEPAPAY